MGSGGVVYLGNGGIHKFENLRLKLIIKNQNADSINNPFNARKIRASGFYNGLLKDVTVPKKATEEMGQAVNYFESACANIAEAKELIKKGEGQALVGKKLNDAKAELKAALVSAERCMLLAMGGEARVAVRRLEKDIALSNAENSMLLAWVSLKNAELEEARTHLEDATLFCQSPFLGRNRSKTGATLTLENRFVDNERTSDEQASEYVSEKLDRVKLPEKRGFVYYTSGGKVWGVERRETPPVDADGQQRHEFLIYSVEGPIISLHTKVSLLHAQARYLEGYVIAKQLGFLQAQVNYDKDSSTWGEILLQETKLLNQSAERFKFAFNSLGGIFVRYNLDQMNKGEGLEFNLSSGMSVNESMKQKIAVYDTFFMFREVDGKAPPDLKAAAVLFELTRELRYYALTFYNGFAPDGSQIPTDGFAPGKNNIPLHDPYSRAIEREYNELSVAFHLVLKELRKKE
jgi:hypothetical protein